jgi:hypothetical protein
MANEAIYDAVSTGTTITPTGKVYSFATSGTPSLTGELAVTVGSEVKLTSKTYATAPTINVSIDGTTKTVIVSTTGFIEDVNSTAKGKTF